MPRVSDATRARSPKPGIPLPDGLWSQGPGPSGTQRQSVDIGTGDWRTNRNASRPSAGKPPAGGAHAPDASWPAANTPMWSRWPGLVNALGVGGPWPRRGREHPQAKPAHPCTHHSAGFRRASHEAPPRCGVTLDGVKRLGKDPRAAREAGTRRRQGRWDPTHGEQPDQPSHFPGSGSSAARRKKTA